MKLLLLLTHSFPYNTGEEFLSGELSRVSGFDRAVVCPCCVKPDGIRTRELPAGIKCFPLRREALGKAAYLRVLSLPCVWQECRRLLRSGHFSSGRVKNMLFFMKNALEIYDALRGSKELSGADDVTIYSYWFYDAAAAGALLAADLRKRGVRVSLVSRAHGFDIHAERSEYGYLPMRFFLLNREDRVFPCSMDGMRTILAEYPQFEPKLRVSYLGTRDAGESPGSREEFHLVSCSYMVPVKRLHLIIEALREADFPVRWTHLGAGPLEEKLKALARELPPNVQAEFAGQMENEAILNYYKTHEVTAFVNVSSSEGIPVSVMEACSFGLPVVATDVGGTSEIVEDGKNGLLLPADLSPQELLAKLRTLRDMSPEEYAGMCAASRSVWSEKFSADRNYGNFYRELCL